MPDSSGPYELDLYAPELLSSPYRTYARLRANRSVHYRSINGSARLAVLSRYADVKLALTDPRFEVVPNSTSAPAAPPLDRMECLASCLSAIVAGLLQPLARHTSFDVIAEFAQPLAEQLRVEVPAALKNGFIPDLVGTAILALLTHRDQLTMMRHPSQRPATAVDELLRFESPVQRTMRTARSDVELPEGDVIEEGQLVTVLIGAANRDYLQFAEPDRLRLDRRSAARHLVFEADEQLRAAAAVVRLVAHTCITDLVCAFPNLQLAADPPRLGTDFELRRLETLRVLNSSGDRFVE
jgi:cytochrome P450